MTQVAFAPAKFGDPYVTAKGEARASVSLGQLDTLWFNTGTLCNIECANCYIESSPSNDRLAYLTTAEVTVYLDEIKRLDLGTREIGFTGGEPFLNPQFLDMLEESLDRDHEVLVLTNAMRPMMRSAVRDRLQAIHAKHGDRLTLRVSLDHYTRLLHETERGPGAWNEVLDGMRWLATAGFRVAVAGRSCWGQSEARARLGYARLFENEEFPIDAENPSELVIFPEMDERADVPEITAACWSILDVDPATVMCASSRMVVKRKDAAEPTILACTLLPYDAQFELGTTLADAAGTVQLNHPHCAKFCVLGGASCSA